MQSSCNASKKWVNFLKRKKGYAMHKIQRLEKMCSGPLQGYSPPHRHQPHQTDAPTAQEAHHMWAAATFSNKVVHLSFHSWSQAGPRPPVHTVGDGRHFSLPHAETLRADQSGHFFLNECDRRYCGSQIGP